MADSSGNKPSSVFSLLHVVLVPPGMNPGLWSGLNRGDVTTHHRLATSIVKDAEIRYQVARRDSGTKPMRLRQNFHHLLHACGGQWELLSPRVKIQGATRRETRPKCGVIVRVIGPGISA